MLAFIWLVLLSELRSVGFSRGGSKCDCVFLAFHFRRTCISFLFQRFPNENPTAGSFGVSALGSVVWGAFQGGFKRRVPGNSLWLSGIPGLLLLLGRPFGSEPLHPEQDVNRVEPDRSRRKLCSFASLSWKAMGAARGYGTASSCVG